MSAEDSARLRQLNKDLIARLFEQKRASSTSSSVDTTILKQEKQQQQQRSSELDRQYTSEAAANKSLVELVRRIVDERLEFYLDKLSAEIIEDEEKRQRHYEYRQQRRFEPLTTPMTTTTTTANNRRVDINEVEVRRNVGRPRKLYVGVESPMSSQIDVDDDNDSVDAYYDEKAREQVHKLSLMSGDLSGVEDQVEASYGLDQIEGENASGLYEEEQIRREMRKWRRAEEKERKKMLKEQMKTAREHFEQSTDY